LFNEEIAEKMIKFFSFRKIIGYVFLLLLGWILFESFFPHRGNLREFDPKSVAKLETDMWRSYYERRPLPLFFQLTHLLRTQYGMRFLKSNYASYEATRAAFVFKKGHGRKDYELALPYLIKYFKSIRSSGNIPFDVNRAAKMELEWWIIHREHKWHPATDLYAALAAVQSEIYQMPAQKFQEHAQFRGDAMLLRDTLAEKGGVSKENWSRINRFLDRSWTSLWRTVNQGNRKEEEQEEDDDSFESSQ
jgi:hypothetical protein